jgi:hypothetical protein
MPADSFEKVRGGKFSFKGGGDLGVKTKKKKKKEKKAAAAAEGDEEAEIAALKAAMTVGEGIGGEPGGDAKGTYEELFPYEKKRQVDGKGRSHCWGTNYREAPEVLHGYTESWKKKKQHEMTAEERLDLRCGSKADKYSK